jgi:hypothetical protein
MPDMSVHGDDRTWRWGIRTFQTASGSREEDLLQYFRKTRPVPART